MDVPEATDACEVVHSDIMSELRQRNEELAECQQKRQQDRESFEAKFLELRQKTKDHVVHLQTAIKQKDVRIQEIEAAHEAANHEATTAAAAIVEALKASEISAAEAVQHASQREQSMQAEALNRASEIEALKVQLIEVENRASCEVEIATAARAEVLAELSAVRAESFAAAATTQDAAVEGSAMTDIDVANAAALATASAAADASRIELEACRQDVVDLRNIESALRAEMRMQDQHLNEAREEVIQVRQEAKVTLSKAVEDAALAQNEIETRLIEERSIGSSRASEAQEMTRIRREAEAQLVQSQEMVARMRDEHEAKLNQANEETAKTRQETEAKLNEVVKKCREHVKQVQGRLETSLGENRELSEKHSQLEASFKQQQEKVAKYKQLMAQANARIEDTERSVQVLQDALDSAQAQKASVLDQLGQRERSLKPPSRAEISELGGILLSVETDDDGVWCLVKTREDSQSSRQDCAGETTAVGRRTRWWPLSQLDLDDKPVPLQRRWKGEVSALRAQMQRFKKKNEDLQQEFDTYIKKASAALQSNTCQGEEIAQRERTIEDLGEQLQSVTSSLQVAHAEKSKATEELLEMRRRLHDSSARSAELEQSLDSRLREVRERRDADLFACKSSFKMEKDALEQAWCEKERAYQQELDLQRAHKKILDEEIEVLRMRLASQPVLTAEPSPEAAGGVDSCVVPGTIGNDSFVGSCLDVPATSEDATVDCPARSSPHEDPPSTAEPAAEPPSSAPSVSNVDDGGSDKPPGHHQLPPQAYALHASVAWQDLVSLRYQVRQLEVSLHEESQRLATRNREVDSLKSELRDISQRQRLQNTVGQQQQMEYIRHIFRKFMEGLPVGGKEQEQLIPVLMTFFSFPDEDAKAIQGKRSQSKGALSGLFGGWSG
eukprot:TRINITY_DN10745_c0_g1_i1.p1 TRINITY_DN10745_c0_g1~~TRINITY_DN10745_c0_g1_i1.p1  ORF type:complete len:900 (+),score=206.34 TRINITY_DN10745_c0_g1_i1:146-2845(+)